MGLSVTNLVKGLYLCLHFRHVIARAEPIIITLRGVVDWKWHPVYGDYPGSDEQRVDLDDVCLDDLLE